MATETEFARRLGAIGTRVAENADKLVRKVAMTIDRTVVMATPVDTGRARSNWIASLNAPSASIREAYAPGKEGSTSGPNAEAAIEQAAGVVAGYDGDKDAEIHIANNLPYIGRLNDGSSAQAPANFVQIAVRRATASVKGAKLLEE
jgi:hypothetical protein